MTLQKRRLVYLGSTEKDASKLPEEVRELFAYALTVALSGGQHEDAKPFKGFNGRGVMEVVQTIGAVLIERCIQYVLMKLFMCFISFKRKARKALQHLNQIWT